MSRFLISEIAGLTDDDNNTEIGREAVAAATRCSEARNNCFQREQVLNIAEEKCRRDIEEVKLAFNLLKTQRNELQAQIQLNETNATKNSSYSAQLQQELLTSRESAINLATLLREAKQQRDATNGQLQQQQEDFGRQLQQQQQDSEQLQDEFARQRNEFDRELGSSKTANDGARNDLRDAIQRNEELVRVNNAQAGRAKALIKQMREIVRVLAIDR
jgi:chromosome segregation ATPase